MDGRAFLVVATELTRGTTEAHWRAAAGRAYYALFLEARSALIRWGLRVPRQDVHSAVRLRCCYAADTGLQRVSQGLDSLVRLRNEADYDIGTPGSFGSAAAARTALNEATLALAALDQVQADAARCAAAVADIRARWP